MIREPQRFDALTKWRLHCIDEVGKPLGGEDKLAMERRRRAAEAEVLEAKAEYLRSKATGTHDS